MAAPAGKMRRVSDESSSSSSSDEEALRRCQEAVWETKPDRQKDGGGAVTQSKRVVVAEHEHDGNELQVTQGFRTHVAKKLESLLNSCISETQIKRTCCVDSVREEEDDGFRLFSTSVPGQTAEDRPAPARQRRPAPSSSDSDSEMESRLKEAAVSVKDLLPSASSCPAAGRLGSEEVNGGKTDAEGEKRKKKKKKKKNAEDCAGSPPDAQRNGENGHSEQEEQQLKVKRKKKKKRKEESESD